MRFETAQVVENVVWTMRLADFPRAKNRALINQLANGAPPYTDDEQVQNRITTNVNYLELTNIAHSARRQFSNAFLNVDPPFNVKADYGAPWRRNEISAKISKHLGRIFKTSLNWYEMRRSAFAQNVLHGIGPSFWNDEYGWCGDPVGVEDVLIPSETLLTMKNLPFFAVFRQYTAMQLHKMTHGPKVDPAWNMPVVEKAIAWADDQSRTLMGASWPTSWSPEKMEERIKSDGALYASDCVPTIDVYDLYYWNDEKGKSGWNRRIVLDAWGSPGPGMGGAGGALPNKSLIGTRGEFLYDSGNRVYAKQLSNIIHWQFADASCVAPFRYHSVRSLGFLLYAVCHLQNRLRCKFNDSVFEAMLQYFRVSNPQDAERLTQVDLIDKGIIPDGLEFVKAADRWQVNEGLADRAMALNRQTMADNSVSFTQDYDFGSEQQSRNETATRTQAKINSTAALVGAMLGQAYKYEEFRYQEICRRFCIKNSKDKDVRKFRVNCLSDGVPEEALQVERWDVTPVRIVGSGDKQLQVSISEALMRIRPLLDPSAQKLVDRIYISSYTEDYPLTEQLVPEVKAPSRSAELASFAAGSLLQGLRVTVEEGIDHTTYVESLIANMALKVQGIEAKGGMATAEEIAGLVNIARHIAEHIKIIAQDKEEKARVKQYGDDLGQLMNLVKGYSQRLAEQQKEQQGAQGQQGGDPKEAAKIQGTVIMAQTKAKLAAESHAQRTAQRQVQFEQKIRQDAANHQAKLEKEMEQFRLELAKDMETHRLEMEKSGIEHSHNLSARELEAASAVRMQAEAQATAEQAASSKEE